MCSSNCCFLTCIQVSQEAGQVVWYSHLFQNFPQFIVIHTVKGFGIVNKAEIDVFLELSCFFDDFLLLYSKFQVLLCSVAAGRIHTQVSNPRCPQNPSPHSPTFTAVKPKRSPDTTKCPFRGKITSSWGPLLWTIEIKSLLPQGLKNAPQWVCLIAWVLLTLISDPPFGLLTLHSHGSLAQSPGPETTVSSLLFPSNLHHSPSSRSTNGFTSYFTEKIEAILKYLSHLSITNSTSIHVAVPLHSTFPLTRVGDPSLLLATLI